MILEDKDLEEKLNNIEKALEEINAQTEKQLKVTQKKERKREKSPNFPTVCKKTDVPNYSIEVEDNSTIGNTDIVIKDKVFKKILDGMSDKTYGGVEHSIVVYCAILKYWNNKKTRILQIKIKDLARLLQKDRKTIRRALYYLYAQKVIDVAYAEKNQAWMVTLTLE